MKQKNDYLFIDFIIIFTFDESKPAVGVLSFGFDSGIGSFGFSK